MNHAERLRTRLMVAAQKFASEVADAVLEATGEQGEAPAPATKRRRAPTRVPSIVSAPAGPEDEGAARAASNALAKLGIRG